jgi:nucleotide-binding universal stress UspA family protein
MFKRILVPLDGSARAERAIPVAARIARASGGSLILLRVANAAIEFCPSLVSESTMVQSVIDTNLAEARQYLADMTTSVELDGIAREQVVLFGSTAPTILSVRWPHMDIAA